MSHGISNIDKQQGIEQAWHGLTEVVPAHEFTLAGSWLSEWDVTKSPLHLIGADGAPIKTDYCQLVATDDNAIRIGAPVHCETYQPITNADFLRIIQNTIDGIDGVQIASVGSVSERGKVFVSIKLAELDSFKAAGREFIPYLNFLNSHDMSAPFGVNTSNTCTVCANTFGMNLRMLSGVKSGLNAAKRNSDGNTVRIRLKHTKNVADRLENIPEIIQGFLGAQAEFRAIMETLDKEELNAGKAKALFAGFLSAPDLPRDISKATTEQLTLSTRRANQIDRLTELFQSGAGNNGRNMADAFNAVTDYYSHENAGGLDYADKQFASSEYGTGQQAKARAYGLFQSPDDVAQLVQVGNAVLAVN